jgi:hypothetical protein
VFSGGQYRDEFDVDQDGNDQEETPDLDARDRILDGGIVDRVDMGSYEHVHCAQDIDGDGIVGFGDLLLVLSTWGPCPDPPDPCAGDIDGNGDVGFSDLLEILTWWGPCVSPFPVSPPQSVQDCIQKYGGNPLNLQKCIEAMLIAGTP